MTEFVRSPDGTRIGYDRVGEGPGVILIGGAIQHRAVDENTRELAERVAGAGFTVINYDRRGRGDSDDASAADPQTSFEPDREVEDIAALLEVVGGEAALYGSSSGCALALQAAAELPVTRLALWEPPFATGEARGEGVAKLASMRTSAAAGDAASTIETFMSDLPPQQRVTAESPFWPVLVQIAPSLVYDRAALVRAETRPWRELWGSIDVPILIMRGDPTLPIFAPAIAELIQVLPTATETIIDGAAWHQWPVDNMVARLTAFLQA